MKKILIIAMGGHARSVVDSIEAIGEYQIAGFVDVNAAAHYKGYGVIGDDNALPQLRESGIEYAAIGLGFMGEGTKRQALYAAAQEAGFILPAIVDPHAVVAADATIKEGVFVGKTAVVNSHASVGTMAIVNTGAIVEHDCVVGAFSHVSVNATLCGGVTIKDNVLIGASATVIQNIVIENDSIVGAGSLVLADVPDNRKVRGLFNGR